MGDFIGSTYLTAGNYKYDAYVAADFAAAGIEVEVDLNAEPCSFTVHRYTSKLVNKRN